MRVMLVTAVWGDWYTDIFGNLLMKSLLAPGNLPKAAQFGDVSYKIYCDSRTASRLQAFPAWPAFRDAAKAEFVITRLIDYDDPIESHHRIWSEALRAARQSRAKVIFVAPDTLWSDGSIGRLMELFSQGYPAIFFPGLRVASDTFETAALDAFPAHEDRVISMRAEALIAWCMEHMHPLMNVFQRNSPMFPAFPENMLWPVGDEGFIIREPITHSLFALDPSEIAVNEYSVPISAAEVERIYWSKGGEDILFLSLGPLARDTHWYADANSPDALEIAFRSLEFDSALVPALLGRKFHFAAKRQSESAWMAAERASDIFAHRIAVSRHVMKLAMALQREGGCDIAAKLLLFGLMARSLGHHVNFPGPVTVFCPVDTAFVAVVEARMDALFAPDQASRLRRFLLAHVAHGAFRIIDFAAMRTDQPETLPPGISVHRAGADIFVNDVRLLKPDIGAGDHVIHLVEKPIAPW